MHALTVHKHDATWLDEVNKQPLPYASMHPRFPTKPTRLTNQTYGFNPLKFRRSPTPPYLGCTAKSLTTQPRNNHPPSYNHHTRIPHTHSYLKIPAHSTITRNPARPHQNDDLKQNTADRHEKDKNRRAANKRKNHKIEIETEK